VKCRCDRSREYATEEAERQARIERQRQQDAERDARRKREADQLDAEREASAAKHRADSAARDRDRKANRETMIRDINKGFERIRRNAEDDADRTERRAEFDADFDVERAERDVEFDVRRTEQERTNEVRSDLRRAEFESRMAQPGSAESDSRTSSQPRSDWRYREDPLRLGDAQDSTAYVDYLAQTLLKDLVVPDPMQVGQDSLTRRVLDGVPNPLESLGDVMGELDGLAEVRDSVIRNAIERLPGYFSEQLDRTTPSGLPNDPSRSAGSNSLSNGSIDRLLDWGDGVQSPAVPSSPTILDWVFNWGASRSSEAKPEGTPPAATRPKSEGVKNLLDRY